MGQRTAGGGDTLSVSRREELRARVVERIDFSRETSDEEVSGLIDDVIMEAAAESCLTVSERKQLHRELFHSIRRLDILEELLQDPEVTEIMVNGPSAVFLERAGRIERCPGGFVSEQRLGDIVQTIVADCDRTVNAASPIADARLRDGSRVNVVLPPVSLCGPVLTIRRFPKTPLSMEDLLRMGALSPEVKDLLADCVRAGLNIFISGGTGAGKTTFLSALCAYIDPGERVITIEDNAELQIPGIEDLVRLEARSAREEGCSAVTIRDMIRASLRMRPDRIIVGEVRGPEAIDMLQAMNTGHDGSMSTGHANSARDMMSRLETMVLMGAVDLPLGAIRGQIGSALDIVVFLGRLRDRSRKLLEVAQVLGTERGEIRMHTLYRFTEKGVSDGKITGDWEKVEDIVVTDKMRLAGVAFDGSGRSEVSAACSAL